MGNQPQLPAVFEYLNVHKMSIKEKKYINQPEVEGQTR